MIPHFSNRVIITSDYFKDKPIPCTTLSDYQSITRADQNNNELCPGIVYGQLLLMREKDELCAGKKTDYLITE